MEGCANKSKKGGVCVTHALGLNFAATSGAPTEPERGGICDMHGTNLKYAAMRGAPIEHMARLRNVAATRGVPMEHGAIRGSVCVTHGAKVKQCSHEGCMKQAQKGGLCLRNKKYSIPSTAQNGAARPPIPLEDTTSRLSSRLQSLE